MGLGQIQPKPGHGAIFQNEIRNRFRKILKIINGRSPRKTIGIMEGGLGSSNREVVVIVR